MDTFPWSGHLGTRMVNEVIKRIDNLGAEPMPMRMDAFDTFVRAEIKLHADIIEKAGIKAQ